MSSLKVVEGSTGFLELAKEKKLCQNDETLQDCMKKKFEEKSFQVCGCVPLGIYNLTSMVRNILITTF